MLFPPIFVFVYLTHHALLRLPYFWDESGYYIPAAYDFFRYGTLIPQSTLSNAHPPLPSVLLAGWWHLSGFNPEGTRTAVCIVASFALLAVYRMARPICGQAGAAVVTVLTALYPVWFAQSSLAHADIFAAAFTLWGLALYFDEERMPTRKLLAMTALFWLAVLSKETALITPAVLVLVEIVRAWNKNQIPASAGMTNNLRMIAALASPVVPLGLWFLYHRHVTGFAFGNPEYLRYNATANLSVQRVGFALFHRAIHLTAHMNLFVPVLCALACLFLTPLAERRGLPRRVWGGMATLLCGYWVFFSVFGGALLTRYLLPAYPMVIMLGVAVWQRRVQSWWPLGVLTGAAFMAGLFLNPPYRFAPEDNLAYRDMIVLQQNATAVILQRWPQATVLTAWPMSDELRKPELGYVATPVKVFAVHDFSLEPMQQAAGEENNFDTALIFSTKYDPPGLRGRKAVTETQYFDYHRDLLPAEAASVLHGTLVWKEERQGQWAAVIRLNQSYAEGKLLRPASTLHASTH